MAERLHSFVAPPGTTPNERQITLGLYQTLVVHLPEGYEPMLTVTDTDARAWVRHKTAKSRIFGKLSNTAEEAVLSLLRKLAP
jgi:hypothetical protein